MNNKIILSVFITFILSALVTAYYFYIRKYRFVGRFYGGLIIAFLGAVLFNIILEPVNALFRNSFAINNFSSVILGAILFLKILRKVTP